MTRLLKKHLLQTHHKRTEEPPHSQARKSVRYRRMEGAYYMSKEEVSCMCADKARKTSRKCLELNNEDHVVFARIRWQQRQQDTAHLLAQGGGQ
jgi:hypothetical protein